eukprot:2098623-Alexandrium_andersonii.AAC.1
MSKCWWRTPAPCCQPTGWLSRLPSGCAPPWKGVPPAGSPTRPWTPRMCHGEGVPLFRRRPPARGARTRGHGAPSPGNGGSFRPRRPA